MTTMVLAELGGTADTSGGSEMEATEEWSGKPENSAIFSKGSTPRCGSQEEDGQGEDGVIPIQGECQRGASRTT